MLKIIFARENVNKEKFAFEHLSQEAIVIVPEQYTLEGEKDALKYQNRLGVAETQIISFTRLGAKIFKAVGAPKQELLDKQGRHILLTKIIREHAEELEVFKNQGSKTSFIDMVNNFISQLKINEVNPKDLKEIQENLDEDSFLRRKLTDIGTIFEKYEDEIRERYTDSEDYISLFVNKMYEWDQLKGREVLVYGFDYFTPKNLLVIKELLKHTEKVNIVLTSTNNVNARDFDTFSITNRMKEKLKEVAVEVGVSVEEIEVPSSYGINKAPSLMHVEREAMALPAFEFEDGGKDEGKGIENITLLRASNYYLEAESAAAYLLSLIRDKDLNFKDVALICNDLTTRGDIYRRVFKRYGIDIFLDEKSGIENAPLTRYVLAMVDIKSKGFRREDVIKLLKTGLTDIASFEDIERLEQFAVKYNITGNKWKTPFSQWEEKEEEYELIEGTRKTLIDPLLNLFEQVDKKKIVKEKIQVFYEYIRVTAGLQKKMEAYVEELVGNGETEKALFQSQVYKALVDVLTQLIEVVGEEKISFKEIGVLLKSGFESVALGIVPPTADMSILGTVQRTRTGDIKALMILGANEGVLPKELGSGELLTEEEKEALAEKDINLLRLKALRQEEEELALYKMLAKPTDYLWMSYATSNGDGEELKPAALFEKIGEIFPQIEVLDDVENRGKAMDLIGSKGSTMYYLSKQIRETMEGKEIDPVWYQVAKWYEDNDKDSFEIMKRGLNYKNKAEKIKADTIEKLYGKTERISPSSIEKYARCPFAHFVNYGLKPNEEKKYSLNSADVGTLYHEVLMILAQKLTEKEIEVTAENSPWISINREKSDMMVEEILNGLSQKYRNGLISSDEEEANKARMMVSICQDSAWAMISHVKSSSIKSMLFEESFGRGEVIKPLEVTVSDSGKKMFIEGKIDRVDILPEGYVKVIDYKSASLTFNKERAKKGWAVQLFLYLEAGAGTFGTPAGTFYFHVDSPMIQATDIEEEKIMEKFWAEYKMDGVMLNERRVLEYIDQSLKEAGKKSDVIKAEIKKDDQVSSANKNILVKADFDELRREIYDTVKNICEDIWGGRIDIEPTSVGKGTSRENGCKYCNYRPICKREVGEV